MSEIRLILIGQCGVGKSSVGNTLLGGSFFRSGATSEPITRISHSQYNVMYGWPLKVFDTPGFLSRENRAHVWHQVASAIAYCAPGPHAFLLVLDPSRFKDEERESLAELKDFFNDESFLRNTILVFTKQADIVSERQYSTLEEYLLQRANDVILDLYHKCSGRSIIVENVHADRYERNQQAFSMINIIQYMLQLNGWNVYSSEHFRWRYNNRFNSYRPEPTNTTVVVSVPSTQDNNSSVKSQTCVIS